MSHTVEDLHVQVDDCLTKLGIKISRPVKSKKMKPNPKEPENADLHPAVINHTGEVRNQEVETICKPWQWNSLSTCFEGSACQRHIRRFIGRYRHVGLLRLSQLE